MNFEISLKSFRIKLFLLPSIFTNFTKKSTMKKVILLFAIVFSVTMHLSAQKVYSTDSKYDADVKVFVADSKYDADLIVYKCSSKYDADGNKGLWYFVDSKYDADKKIYFVSSKYDADIIIYFSSSKYDADWRDSSKKHVMY